MSSLFNLALFPCALRNYTAQAAVSSRLQSIVSPGPKQRLFHSRTIPGFWLCICSPSNCCQSPGPDLLLKSPLAKVASLVSLHFSRSGLCRARLHADLQVVLWTNSSIWTSRYVCRLLTCKFVAVGCFNLRLGCMWYRANSPPSRSF